MATYNGERFLPEMLGSLAAQSQPPDEVVVRDDGSDDSTVALLQSFSARMPFPVRVIVGDVRLGYAQNFVAASRACSGDVIFFADQDDHWHPDKLASVTRRVRSRQPLALFHDMALVDEAGRTLAPSYWRFLADRALPHVVALKGCGIAVTRSFVDTWGWPPPQAPVSHDVWVALLATAFGQREEVPEALVDHRLHSHNASGWLPDDTSRAFTARGDESGPVRLLVDLLIKPPRLRARTRAFLDVLQERGDAVDPRQARRLRHLLRVNLRYGPPAGALGKAIATLMNTEPSQQVSDDLRRFKQLLETG